jgi:hypothetical protein
LKIAILGAPGSGKTELAEALANKFETGPTGIVDGYVDRLSDETDLVFGHAAGFTGNLQIAFERIRAEQLSDAYHLGVPRRITCGTLVETILYTRLYAEGRLKVAPRSELSHEMIRGQNTSAIFGQLIWDTWRYDHVFINPYSEAKAEEEGDSWNGMLNSDLISGVEAFFVAHQVLSGSVEQRAQQAYDWITHDSEAASSNQ